MKKINLFLLALPLIGFASCSDDKDFPDVNANADIYGYYYVEGQSTRYVLPDDNLVFGAVNVTSEDGQQVGVVDVNYLINGYDYYLTNVSPFTCVIPTSVFRSGENIVTLDMTLAAVGYELTKGAFGFQFVAVDSEEDLPAGAIYVPVPDQDNDTPSQAE